MYLVAYYVDEGGCEKLGVSAHYNRSTVDCFITHPIFEGQKVPALELSPSMLNFFLKENVECEIDVTDMLSKLLLEKSVQLFEELGVEDGVMLSDFVYHSSNYGHIKLASEVPF